MLDPPLIRILTPIAEKSALQTCGVEDRGLFPLSDNALPASCPPNVIYFCRPQPKLMKVIANQIKFACVRMRNMR